MAVTVSRLFVYPVKSLAGVEVTDMPIDARGPVGDRRFMVVDPSGGHRTARELPRMSRIVAELGDAELELSFGGLSVTVALREDAADRSVTVWGDTVDAADQGDAAAAFFTDVLGVPSRLVRQVGPRPVRGETGGHVSFADGFPFLFASQASVDAVKAKTPAKLSVDVRRFRPNILVDGLGAFGEDELTRFRIGDVPFRVTRPCARCEMVDVDPDQGLSTKGVLATLTTFRRQGTEIFFGQNLVHGGEGTIRVGDRVEPVM